MNNKELIAKWRKLHKRTRLGLTHQVAGLMLDMLGEQQVEIEKLTKDNERLGNEIEEWVYASMGEDV